MPIFLNTFWAMTTTNNDRKCMRRRRRRKKRELKTRQQQCQQQPVAAIQLFFFSSAFTFYHYYHLLFNFCPSSSSLIHSLLCCRAFFSFASSITMLFCVFGNFFRREWSNALMAKTAAQTRQSSIVFSFFSMFVKKAREDEEIQECQKVIFCVFSHISCGCCVESSKTNKCLQLYRSLIK